VSQEGPNSWQGGDRISRISLRKENRCNGIGWFGDSYGRMSKSERKGAGRDGVAVTRSANQPYSGGKTKGARK